MSKRPWTAQEDAQLRELFPDRSTAEVARILGRSVAAVYGRAKSRGIEKDAEYIARQCRIQKGTNLGERFNFKPGQVPHNKGLRRPGFAAGRMRDTQFKPGNLPHTTVPIGTEVVRKDGYVWVKMWDDRTPARNNWISKHQRIYEAAHGPIARGCIVRFINGIKTDFRLENLECVSRADHAATVGLQSLPPEVRQVHQLRGAIQRQINKRQPPVPVRRGRPPKAAERAR